MIEFQVKDSGQEKLFDSGMKRDSSTGKVDYTLVLDGPMFQRWATHLTKGAEKRGKRNWMLADGEEELIRARESAFRHFIQWMNGETDEDHVAACFFNLNLHEYISEKMTVKSD